MRRITIIAIILSSFMLGIFSGLALWFAGSWSTSVRTNARVFYETQEFKDAVAAGPPFDHGGYKFTPKKRSIIVEYRADQDKEAPAHAEKARKNNVRVVGR